MDLRYPRTAEVFRALSPRRDRSESETGQLEKSTFHSFRISPISGGS